MRNSTMLGVGITPEGINQNYVMYEFALERAWEQTPINVTKWIEHYAFVRYGIQNDHVKAAWNKLLVNGKLIITLDVFVNNFIFRKPCTPTKDSLK